MIQECDFILAPGRKCHGIALQHQTRCRHHALVPPAPRLPRHQRYSRLARWTELGRSIGTRAPEELPFEIWEILNSLLEDGIGGISDRVAGRLLRGLLRRLGQVPFPSPQHPEPPAPAQAAEPSVAHNLTRLHGILADFGRQGLIEPELMSYFDANLPPIPALTQQEPR